MTGSRRACLALFAFGLAALVFAAPAAPQDAEFEFRENVMIPMSDGVKLAAHIFIPKGEGPFPVLLQRSPYGKGDRNNGQARHYVNKGYAMVSQDTRGRGDSEGVWDPFKHEGRDGYETQEWIGQREWCNGKIGTFGGSYVGYTQWISAPYGSEYLKAMIPEVPFAETYDLQYVGGAYQQALCFQWGTAVSPTVEKPFEVDFAKGHFNLPLLDWEKFVGAEIFYIREWLSHPQYDDYWRERGVGDGYKDITVPILNIGGWYDIFSKDTLEIANRVRHSSKDRMARRNLHVIMGPWHHGGSDNGKVGQLDFGAIADLERRPIRDRWYDYWLMDKETGVEEWPFLTLFVMGENVWRAENEWPLKRTQWTDYYLRSGGNANSLDGDGALSLDAPGDEPPDVFVYDPANPVPSLGGNHLGSPPTGPYDQAEIEKRDDVLVYTTPPLEEAVEATGPVTVTLFAQSSAPDTDFTAKLVDVHPDGKAYNLCDGIVRARHREPDAPSSLIEPGNVYEYEIDLWVTSNLFKKGHRIRLEISSSNFPRFDRNPNSGKPFATDTEVFKATQTVLHNTEHPSRLTLPVIPGNGGGADPAILFGLN